MSKTSLSPTRYHVIVDDAPEVAISLFENASPYPINVVSSKRFPFTIKQVMERCKSVKFSEAYRHHLLCLYSFSILNPISDYVLIMEPYLYLDTTVVKLFEDDHPIYNSSHGSFLPYFLHMKKLLPTLEKKLYTSAISPYFILNKEITSEMIHTISDHHDSKPFWHIYLDALDPMSYYENASWQEMYLNYVAIKYPKSYSIEKHYIYSSYLHQLDITKLTTVNYQDCSAVFSSLYSSILSLVNKSGNIYEFQLIPYMTYIKQIRASIPKESVTIVDIGCGIFNSVFTYVPWKLTDKYIGIDCVESAISFNKQYHADKGSFIVADATHDNLPNGDICLVRNVLGNLSNVYIQIILHQLRKYNYVLITDVVPNDQILSKLNTDKATDTYFRPGGLWLESAPFVMMIQTVLNLPIDKKTSLRTVLIRN